MFTRLDRICGRALSFSVASGLPVADRFNRKVNPKIKNNINIMKVQINGEYLAPSLKVVEVRLRRRLLIGSEYMNAESFGRYDEGFGRQDELDLD